MKQNFNQKLMQEKDKTLVVALNSIFRYIDDVLSINNSYFHSYVKSSYESECEIQEHATDTKTSVLYLCIY